MTRKRASQQQQIDYDDVGTISNYLESNENDKFDFSSEGDDISKFNERVKLFDSKFTSSTKAIKLSPISNPNSGGTIQSIELFNFMCHEHLKVELKDNINFIVGNNGSGKSAILTALTVCLGARASSTQRATSLESLIKEGATESKVVITISNSGALCFKHDLYGDAIVIERRFKRNGPNSFKIKSGTSGRIISEKKDEVVSICDNYNIQVDNPLSVLTQETAKKFLVNSTAHDLYEFFMRATQLEQLSFDYAYSLDRMKSMQHSLFSATKLWPALEARIEKLKIELKTISEQKEIVQKMNELRAEILWVEVESRENDMHSKETQISDYRDNLSSNNENIEVLNQKLSEIKVEINSIDSEIISLHDNKRPLNEEISLLERNINITKNDLKDTDVIQKKIHADITKSRQDLSTIEQKIGDCAKNADSDRIQKLGEISRLEDLILEKNRHCNLFSEELNHNSKEIGNLEANLDSAQQMIKNEKRVNEELSKELDSVQSAAREKIKLFGDNLPEAMKQIKARINEFVYQPIGPIGMHIELKDMTWSVPMDATIGQYMRNFITRDHSDQKLLESIFKSCNCPEPINIAYGEPDSKFLTALRALKIDNEFVTKALVIFTNLEKIALIPDHIEARETVMSRFRNIDAVFTHSHRISATPNSVSFSAFVPKKRGGNPFESCENRARYISKQLKDSTHRLTIASRDLENIIRAIAAHRDTESELKDKIYALKTESSSLKSDIRELEDQLNSRNETGVDVFIGEKESINNKLNSLTAQLADCVENKTELNKKLMEISHNLTEVKYSVVELEKMIKQKNTDLNEMSSQKRKIQCEIERLSENNNFISSNIQASIDSLNLIKDSIRELENNASKLSDRIISKRTISSIEKEIVQLEKLMESGKNFGPEDYDIIKKEFDECSAEYEKSKVNVRINENILDDMKIALEKRQRQWEDLRSGIAKRSNQDFIACLQARDYRGYLDYDHKTRELHINVHIDNIEKTDELSKRDIKQLSGGEKSFGTTCFLLSLWDAMGCPIRCLDEFDVYMDAVNRRLVVEMLINNAKNSGTQFILITPVSVRNFLESGDADSVHMVTLKDPHRSS